MKKIIFVILTTFLLATLPTYRNVSSASDCYITSNGQCGTYDLAQSPFNYRRTEPAVVQNPSGQIWQQGSSVRNGNACSYTATITWQTFGASSAQVSYFDASNNGSSQEQTFAVGTQGSQQFPLLIPDRSYRFSLWDTSAGKQNLLNTVWISGVGLNCGIPDSSQYYPVPSTHVNGNSGNYTNNQNTYYDPYGNYTLFSPPGSTSSYYQNSTNNNYNPYSDYLTTVGNGSYQSQSNGNNYYNPYSNYLSSVGSQDYTNYQTNGNTYYNPYSNYLDTVGYQNSTNYYGNSGNSYYNP